MNESKIELTERLRKEGFWAEASKRKDDKVKEFRAEGLSRREAGQKAWEWLAIEYPPVTPSPLADSLDSDDSATKPGGTVADVSLSADTPLETLRWVAKALGRIANGKKIRLPEIPSEAAYAVLDWAKKDPDAFFAMWASSERQRETEPTTKKPRKHFSTKQIESMLRETLAEAKKIETAAAAKAEALVATEFDY